MEYFCPYCEDWQPVAYIEDHWLFTHEQENVTYEKLSERMAIAMGGLVLRDSAPEPDSTNKFKTNNFTHDI